MDYNTLTRMILDGSIVYADLPTLRSCLQFLNGQPSYIDPRFDQWHRTVSELIRERQNAAANQVFNIGSIQGNVGNVTNSQVTVYDYSFVCKLLIDRNVPKTERRALEDIMDELKTAPLEKKPGLTQKATDWVVKNKEFLGAHAEIVAKAIGVYDRPRAGVSPT